jgi:hypothetical protein
VINLAGLASEEARDSFVNRLQMSLFTPRGVDNKIVSSCTTHVYGRMNAPATIDAIHGLMAAKGAAADDIGKLSKGEFYFSTEGSPRPFKVRTSLCLSWHPPNPPTAEEVIQKARSKRG